MVAPASRPPRLARDPDKYIRRVKGGKYQARPYDALSAERENLGTFATLEQARKAVLEFWWGKRKPRPKFVRPIQFRTGTRYLVLCPAPAGSSSRWTRVGEWFDTEAEAARVAEEFVRVSFPPEVAAVLLGRRDQSRNAKRNTIAPYTPTSEVAHA